ncbi:MAG TPA: MraY family glycosyltransferase [Candidatus Eisenbacteria bacterium]|nr:MraY family glycosyltransferase [Candidatus Eisenbacteria bacterium]
MPYSLALALAAFVATLALTRAVMALAHRAGALDHPGPRHVHAAPTPTMGGLGFAAAVIALAWIARALPGPARELDARPLVGWTLATIPVLFLGVVDDLRGTGPWTKLLVQACAALVLVQFGYGVPVLTNPFGAPIASGAFSVPLTVAWVLLVVNAINLIDGLDGLAAGAVLIASASLWWVARMHADLYVMYFASLLIGATAGFLRWNFPPARVFMGDTGSQFLGLTLAAASLLENRKGTAAVTLLFPLVAMAVPIADSVLAFVRRVWLKRPVFRGDTEHIHHRLVRLGLSHRGALFVLWYVCAYFAVMAVILAALPRGYVLLLVLVLGAGLLFALEMLEVFDRHARAARGADADEAERSAAGR